MKRNKYHSYRRIVKLAQGILVMLVTFLKVLVLLQDLGLMN